MRHRTAAASILAVGIVAAACGGDAAPEPGADASVAPAATAAADAPTAPAADASPAAETAYLKKAQHSSAGDPGATFPLVAGRYRMGWTTGSEAVDRCTQVDLLVSQVDGDFTFPKRSRSAVATAIINDLPEGHFTIEQLDPDCTEWNIRIDWMTN